jgi:hypothetical protein
VRQRARVQQTQLLARAAIGEERRAALFRTRGKFSSVRIIAIDDRRAAGNQKFTEQTRFGVEIVLHGAVVIEMIAREIGEGRRRNLQSVEAILIEPMAGRFDRDMLYAVSCQRLKIGMKIDGIGRGEPAAPNMPRGNKPERAKRRGRATGRGPDLT